MSQPQQGSTQTSMVIVALTFLSAFLISLIFTPVIRNWALDKHIVDSPGSRKVHVENIPRLGGVAILCGFLIPLLLFVEITPALRGLIVGSLIIFATGLIDDIYHLKPKTKFLGQGLACLIVIILGKFYIVNLGNIFGSGPITLPFWATLPFTIFAVIGVSNAINLIDGLDGLAGGVSAIALAAFVLISFQTGNPFVLGVSASLLGSVIGFLKHNLYPARIFMGDGGSLFCGFVLAILAISLTQQGADPVAPILPLVVLGVPIIDTLWVMTRRLRHGTNPFIADRTHLHHKFLDLGFQHRFTVVIIYSFSWLWAGVVIALTTFPDYLFFYGYLAFTLLLYLGLRYILNHKDTFTWTSRDSMAGIRDSVTFNRLIGLSSGLLPMITLFLAVYPLAAILLQGDCCTTLQPVFIIFFCVLTFAFLPTFQSHKGLRLTLTYLAILLIIYVIRTDGAQLGPIGDHPAYRVADIVLLIGLTLTAINVFLHSQWEHFLTSMDSLLIGTSLLMAIFFLHQPGYNHLPGVLLRGMVYYHGLKVLGIKEKSGLSVVVSAILLTLLVVAVKPFLT